MDYKRFYAEIKLDAIEKNVANVKKNLNGKTKIMAVIKADGYGHGAVELASFLKNKVDWFGVATLDEAIELRNSGCSMPILILGATMADEFEAVIENDITVAIVDRERAEMLNNMAAAKGKTANVHIKLDTGMARIGFDVSDESLKEIEYICKLPNLNAEGLFSHFARADEADKACSNRQLEIFTNTVNCLEKQGIVFPIKHISNSAGIMELNSPFNMVRMGIMLYGLYPSHEVDRRYRLYPAMSLHSRITFVKKVKAGTGISYGHSYITPEDTLVATIPVGYADGYPRNLSNKGYVIINGSKCPIVGKVCMDQTMIKINEGIEAPIGNEVVIVGESLSVDTVSELAGSFNYEFVCGISRRVPRVYTYNGEVIKIKSYLD